MRYYQSTFLLIVVSLFLSAGSIKNKRLYDSSKKRSVEKPVLFPDDFRMGYSSVYEVRLVHTGYTSFNGTPDDCPIRSNGTVTLSGQLSGDENTGPDDPILYTGVLNMEIDMDICSVKRMANGEDKVCGMTVRGSGRVYTELELDTTSGGGYIKIRHDSTAHGRFQKSVGGTCDQPQQAEEEYMVPNKTIASIFNGRSLPMLLHRTLRVGRYTETEDQNKTVVEVIRKIR